MGRAFGLAAALAAGLVFAAAGASVSRDPALLALNVLPPGQAGNGAHLTDQIELYDALTPKQADVSARDLPRMFKPETLGVSGNVTRVERPKAGVRILRDRWDMPHV
jgi:hypothetical protein